MFTGELISLTVAFSWTITALVAEVASKRIGALQLNVIRMSLSLLLLAGSLWLLIGHPYPYLANQRVWFWMSLSGFVGYVFGDWCLFNAYVSIGSRFGQLFMTLASPFAALAAWVILDERLPWTSLLGIAITMFGIGMSILSRPTRKKKVNTALPVKGVLLGIGAGAGQGIGLVLSKVGLTEYQTLTEGMSPFIAPLAGTMIRAITGLVCFLILVCIQHRFCALRTALKDGRGMHFAFWATITGPFVGVSLSLLAVQLAPAGIAQTLMSLTPILILWPSHHFLGTQVTPREIIGAVIAVCGVTLFFI